MRFALLLLMFTSSLSVATRARACQEARVILQVLSEAKLKMLIREHPPQSSAVFSQALKIPMLEKIFTIDMWVSLPAETYKTEVGLVNVLRSDLPNTHGAFPIGRSQIYPSKVIHGRVANIHPFHEDVPLLRVYHPARD